MKTKLLSLLLIILLAQGCCDDDKNGNPLAGNWKLTNVSGGFIGIDDDFAPGTIIWNFNTEAHTVTIANNNTDPDKQDVLESGTYDYEIVTNDVTPEECEYTMEINGVNYGCFTITSQQLVISQLGSDGLQLTLIR